MRGKYRYDGYKSTFGQTPEPPRGNGKGMFLLCLICGVLAMACFGVVGQSAYSKHQAQAKAAAVALQDSQAAAVQRRMTVFPKAPGARGDAKMASYLVSGAGTAAANGIYTEDVSPAYQWSQESANIKIIYDGGFENYQIQNYDTTDVYYETEYGLGNPPTKTPDECTWSVVNGSSPAPTVTEYVAPDETAPTYDSAATSTDGTQILVQLTEADSPPILPATGVTGFTLKVNGVARTVTGATAESETEVIGYNATGAGDATWDGDYFNDGTTSAGGLRFKLDATHYLWYQPAATRWLFYPESDEGVSNEAYRTDTGQSSTDPSGLSYTLGVSAQPGPTVTAITTAASNTATLTVAGKIYIGDTVTTEYDSATGNVTDSASNAMASFGAQSVTNNSTIERPAAYRPVVWDEENARPKRLGEGEEINAYIPTNINPVQTLTDGATITWDVGNNPIEKAFVTLEGNRTLDITGAGSGQQGILFVQQDATGGRTLALPANSKVVSDGGGVVPLSPVAGDIDAIAFLFDGADFYWTRGAMFS